MPPPGPHDELFKASFGQPDVARSEIELVLPAAVREQLDLSTLVVRPGSFSDPTQPLAEADLLYAVRTRAGGEALIYVLFEHQSSFDATMPFRLLRYMVRIWEQWREDHPVARLLPVIVPIVLHHGDAAWRAAPELTAMLDASPELLDASRPFVPHFRFILDDLAALSLDALSSRGLSELPLLVQLALWASRSFPRLASATPLMRAVMGALAFDERTRLRFGLLHYLWDTAPRDVDAEVIRTILLEIAGPEGREDVMNAGEQLRAEGREQGREQGRAEGLRAAVTAVMSARQLPLSEAGRARLASCTDVATLTRWHARALTATTEGEVFADDPR